LRRGLVVFGLIVRLTVLFAVVFGVIYGITRALRANAHSKEARRIQADIRALKAGIEQGLYSQHEYEQIVQKLASDCEREGIDVPNLPDRVKKRRDDDGEMH
jgi:hypothetical protein